MRFAEAFPGSRAKAFVWYLKQGHLVTFYRKLRSSKIKVLKRYLLNWDSHQTTIEEWTGDYDKVVTSLDLMPPRWRSEKKSAPAYPFRTSEEAVHEPHGKGSRIVVLSPDVAAHFSDSDAVNQKLRESIVSG